MPASELSKWESGGRYLQASLFGNRIFCREYGSPNAAPENTLLLIHGFPESSYSWHKIVEGMSALFERVVLFDLMGYGFSDKPTENFTYSLFEQADVALQVWQQLGVRGGHLLAHDMGDSVATELIARHVSGMLPAGFSAGFQSFTFTNGSMVLEMAQLRLGQKALLSRLGPIVSKLSNAKTFKQQALSAHGNDRLRQKDVDLMWESCQLQDGHLKNHLFIKYLNDRRRFEKTRWLPSLGLVREPIHLCWGDADEVASVKMARFLKAEVCTSATLTVMPEVGHFCQISDSEIWVDSVSGFYQSLR